MPNDLPRSGPDHVPAHKGRGWWILFWICLQLAACHSPLEQDRTNTEQAPYPTQRFVYERPQLGTLFRLVLYAGSEAQAKLAANSAFERIEELDAILSDYKADSELSRLCALTSRGPTGDPVPVSRDLYRVLLCAQKLSTKTGGAFDVTVGSFTKLWRRAHRQGRLPSDEALASARRASGYQKLVVEKGRAVVRLLASNMRIDLGAIAKGYIIDEAMQCLLEHGIRSALIDGGGDLLASAAPPGEKGWPVLLEAPTKTNHGDDSTGSSQEVRMLLADAALATSGDRYRYVDIGGLRYSHLIDPRTGLGLTQARAASVLAESAMLADAWASALCVLPSHRGADLLQAESGLEARIDQGGVILITAGFGKAMALPGHDL